MSTHVRSLVATLVFVAASLFTVTAWSLPRFSVREGLPCSACHVDPSGGGERNAYGRVYGATRLPLAFPGTNALRAPLTVGFGDTLSFGADSRTAYIYQVPPTGAKTSTFFQMEASLYVAAKVYDGLTLYFREDPVSTYEAWVSYERKLSKWASVYVKAGRFLPTYGLRLENHDVWIRQDIGLGPLDQDTGLEAGAYLGPFLLQASVLNGALQGLAMDDDTDKAIVARMEMLQRIGPLKLLLGGSTYRGGTGLLSTNQGITVDSRATIDRTGAFAGASLGRFTYLFEIDVYGNFPYPSNTQGTLTHSLQDFQELDVMVVPGLELNFNWEVRDPNMDLRTGREMRGMAGFDIYPIPHVDLQAFYRQTIGTGPGVVADVGAKEFIAMAHVFF